VDDAARREIVRRLVEFGEKAGFLRVSSVADRVLGDGERREGTRVDDDRIARYRSS
jgi:hypothetical protein